MYFTSDLHLGHKKMLEARPFHSMKAHDDLIIGQLKAVNPKSEIWILGDISCGEEEYALERLSEVPAKMHLVSGNHDSVWPYHRNAHNKQRKFLEVFESVSYMARVHIGGRKVFLHHDWHDKTMPDSDGVAMLHGHTHSSKKLTSYNVVNMCPEAWEYRVASAAEVSAAIDETMFIDRS